MPAGTCSKCGADEVRAKGLCARCYYAGRYDRAPAQVGAEVRAAERAWDSYQLVAALVAELPEPGRHQGASWASRAACRDHPGLPWEGNRASPEMRAVCAGCPVRAACLAEALADASVAGVWAGTTPAERRGLRLQARSGSRRTSRAAGGLHLPDEHHQLVEGPHDCL